MNLLVVCAYFPTPTGGANARNYHLLKALTSEHNVSVLALLISESDVVPALPTDLKNRVQKVQLVDRPTSYSKRWQQLLATLRGKSYLLELFQSVELQEKLDEMIASDHYDVLLFESMLVAEYKLPAGIKVMIDQHNIEHELLLRTFLHERSFIRKWYNWWESRLVKKAEIERCSKADSVSVTSERECDALRLILKNKGTHPRIEVVPNGVDLESFSGESTEPEQPYQIIFTGSMDYYPNSSGVLYFAQCIWPLILEQLPGTTWQIVGRNPPREVLDLASLPGVTVTGTVPDIRPYLAASAVAIVPLQIGSGTRLKILEALAMRKAVVSTGIGSEGLAVEHGTHLLIEDQPEAFAQAVVTLLQDPALRSRLGNAGRSLVEAEYSWQRCGDRLLAMLQEKEKAFI